MCFSASSTRISSAELVQKSDTAGEMKKVKVDLNEFVPISPTLCVSMAVHSIINLIRNLSFLMLRRRILKLLTLYVGFSNLIKWLIYSYTKSTFYF